MLVAMQKQQLGQPFRLLTLGVQFSVEVSPLLLLERWESWQQSPPIVLQPLYS